MGTEQTETVTETLESAVQAPEETETLTETLESSAQAQEERETLTETLESSAQAQEERETLTETLESSARTQEERETLTETLESSARTQEERETLTETLESAVDGDEGVKDEEHIGGDCGVIIETTVVKTETSVEKTFLCSNGSDGGFTGDVKKTGSSAVEGVTDGDSTLLDGDGLYKGGGLGQNDVSAVVEVHGSLDGVNEKGGNCGYVHNEGCLVEGSPGKENMTIPGSERNGKFEANHNGGESNGEGEEDEGDQEHEYSVGDFVWGKIRSHPWWPGRIYDPSNASEYARRYSQGEKLLVAYFGDESFSWCSPSQLKPFAEDFEDMSEQSNSKSFLNAVQNAVDEIGKLVDLQMACHCISDKNRIELHRYAATNAGIKEGVLVPDCDVNKLLIPLNGPTELLSKLRHIAEAVSVTSLLELTVLRSWLSAFYRAKGVHKLPVYYEPMSIEGLEDKSRRNVGVTGVNDFSRVVEVPFGPPVEEDWISSHVHPGLGRTNQSLLQKCPGIAEDKLYERRKKKTVAELIEEDMVVKPDHKKGSFVKNVTAPGSLVKTSVKERGKSSDEAVSRDGSDLTSRSGKKRGRGKRSETEGSAKSQENEVQKDRDGGGEGEVETLKEESVSSVGNDNTGAKDESHKDLASGRKRGRRKRVETQEHAKKKVLGEKSGNGEGEEESKEKNGVPSVGNEHTDAKEETEKVVASEKKRARRKRVETQKSGEKKVPREKNGGEEGTKKKGSVSNIGNGDTNVNQENEKGLASRRKRSRGKKEETQGLEKSAEKEVKSVKSGGGEGEEETKEDNNVLSAANDDSNIKGETEKGLASRERKKSKYLSPPFTSLKRGVRSSYAEKDYLEAESEKIAKVARMGERMISAAGQLIRSAPVADFSEETKVDTIAISTPYSPREDPKKIIDSVEINASAKEVVTEVRSAALDPLHLMEKTIVDQFTEFISAFRSAVYLNGSNYKIYHKHRPGTKRMSPSSGTDTEIPESKSRRKRNENKEQEILGVQKLEKDGVELGKKKRKNKERIDRQRGGESSTTPVSLLVTFPSGFSLPSKNDLKAVFSKFGVLNERETEVLYNSSCAMVVFVKSSDAKEAFNASVRESPFGPAKVSYRLRYYSDDYQRASSSPPPKEGGKIPVDDASRTLFTVKEKLELMTSMLKKSDGNKLPEVQSKLEAEMKGLLDVVNTVVAKSATAHME